MREPPRTPEQEWRIEEARQRALKEPPARPVSEEERLRLEVRELRATVERWRRLSGVRV
jgi:hypothetical protein